MLQVRENEISLRKWFGSQRSCPSGVAMSAKYPTVSSHSINC